MLLSGEDILARKAGDAPARFNILSLPAWLALAHSAGVPFIAARPLFDVCAERFRAQLNTEEGETGYDELMRASCTAWRFPRQPLSCLWRISLHPDTRTSE